jgi:hypothetical protein
VEISFGSYNSGEEDTENTVGRHLQANSHTGPPHPFGAEGSRERLSTVALMLFLSLNSFLHFFLATEKFRPPFVANKKAGVKRNDKLIFEA